MLKFTYLHICKVHWKQQCSCPVSPNKMGLDTFSPVYTDRNLPRKNISKIPDNLQATLTYQKRFLQTFCKKKASNPDPNILKKNPAVIWQSVLFLNISWHSGYMLFKFERLVRMVHIHFKWPQNTETSWLSVLFRHHSVSHSFLPCLQDIPCRIHNSQASK